MNSDSGRPSQLRSAANAVALGGLLNVVAWLSNRKVRAVTWQAAAVVILALAGWWLISNLLTNLEVRRVGSGFGFLLRPSSIPIAETLIDYQPGDSNLRAIAVGVANTLLVAVVGIVCATIFGVIIGVARLSSNWLLARLAKVYIEFVRNVPLLAHLFVIYALLQALPPIRAPWSLGGVVMLSNRGMALPALAVEGGWSPVLGAFLAAILIGVLLNRYAQRVQDRSGHRPKVGVLSAAFLLALPLAALLAQGAVPRLVLPEFTGVTVVGGFWISPEFTALLSGLALYYAAFIAEIVRGGLLAISRGQWDAGYAVGLSRGRVLRLVIIPQALRLIVPATTNQYLDLAKSSSLAIAIGYPDLVTVVNSIITDTGQAVESVAIIMGVFLAISLTIAAIMNWYNARVRLVER